MRSKRSFYPVIKRAADVAVTLPVAIAALPLTAVVAGMVRVKLGKPVLFRQPRPGKDGEVFELIKFRSMLPVDPDRGQVTNAERMTDFGRKLRATSLDELPSLWNVIKGDMSLIGPRPLRVEYLNRYTPRQRLRHRVRPGVTGLAQVSGRNSLSWNERLELDITYVREMSARLDLTILWRTIGTVLSRQGITDGKDSTMSVFDGPTWVGEGFTLAPVRAEDLGERVRWLSDKRVREGITISFMPDDAGMAAWFEAVTADGSRLDLSMRDAEGKPQAMLGFTNVTDTSAELYLFVNPDRQGQGLGSTALRFADAVARDYLWEKITLETKVGNEGQIRFYQRQGYRQIGVKEDKVLMEKQFSIVL